MSLLSRVFISYQRTDEAFARQVREHLMLLGVATWMDQYDIPAGAYWPDAIDAALVSSDTVVGLLSPDAVDSRNVKNEWDWALQNGKPLILLQVAPCLVPHRYVSINFIDATGSDPAPALAALSRALGIDTPTATEPSPTRHVHRVPRPASRIPTFLVGREREQAMLRAQLDQLREGHGSLVLIGGEAGIGKTTLTSWLAAEAESRGAVVLTGGCYDLTTTPPYGPWGEIIRSWPGDAGFPPVPDELRGGEAMARLQSQAALFELAADLFATASTAKPLAMLLEDLHWADQASLDLLRYLSRLVTGFRLMLVVTYRSDELTRRHPLYQLLPILTREANAERIGLHRLDLAAIRDLITSRYALADSERERLAAHVQRATEGNPLFAVEVLRELEESGALQQQGDGWQLGDLDRMQPPELVRQVINGRLERLGEEARHHLEIAAVLGYEVPVDLWAELSDADEHSLVVTLEKAVEAKLVEELDRGDRFRFTHALVRETLYEGFVSLRRRSWHRKAAQLLVTKLNPDPDVIAHHFQQAGDEEAIEWLIRAGDRAQRSFAWIMAIQRFDAAIDLLDTQPGRHLERGWLMLRTSVLARVSDPRHSLQLCEEAEAVGQASGDRWLELRARQMGAVANGYLGNNRKSITDQESVNAAGALFTPDEIATWLAMSTLLTGATSVASMDGDRLHAALVGNHVIEHFASFTIPVHYARVGMYRLVAEIVPGLLDAYACVTLADEPSVFLHYGISEAWGGLGFALAALGQPAEARVAMRRCIELSAAHDPYIELSRRGWQFHDAFLPYDADDLAERDQHIAALRTAHQRATGALSGSGNPWLHTYWILAGEWGAVRDDVQTVSMSGLHTTDKLLAVISTATLDRYKGRGGDLFELLRSVVPDGPATEPGNVRLLEGLAAQRLLAEAAIDAGDLVSARAWLEAHDRWLEWSGAVLGQVEGHLGWAGYYRETGDHDAAEQQAQSALAKASNPRQPLGLIAANRLLGELATQRGDHDAAREHLSESLALAERCEAPYEIALIQTALAELRVAAGEWDGARALLVSARDTCERLGAAPQISRITALEGRLA